MKYKKEVFQAMAMVTQLGISMLAPVILCTFIGYWLDNRFGWNTTIVWLLLGLLAGMRNSWILLKGIQKMEGKKKDD